MNRETAPSSNDVDCGRSGYVFCCGDFSALRLPKKPGVFFTPSQVMAHEAPQGRPFRVGGMVTTGSLKRLADGVSVQFSVTDTAQTMNVLYKGVLPDLFKEGKGVVVEGALQGEAFVASQVLAKHDENYMPPEAADALKKAQETNARAAQTLAPLAKP